MTPFLPFTSLRPGGGGGGGRHRGCPSCLLPQSENKSVIHIPIVSHWHIPRTLRPLASQLPRFMHCRQAGCCSGKLAPRRKGPLLIALQEQPCGWRAHYRPRAPLARGSALKSSPVQGNFCDDGNGCICWPSWGPPTTCKHLHVTV